MYLDYEEGEISFYNADTRAYIHTLTDTFTEILYPFFYTSHKGEGESAPLIICPVSAGAESGVSASSQQNQSRGVGGEFNKHTPVHLAPDLPVIIMFNNIYL